MHDTAYTHTNVLPLVCVSLVIQLTSLQLQEPRNRKHRYSVPLLYQNDVHRKTRSILVVRDPGLEPGTSRLSVERSNHLS